MRNRGPEVIALGLSMWVLVLAPTARVQEQPKQIVKEPARRISSVAGSDTFREYCAACHGIGGRGNGPAATALKVPPADLTMLTKRHEGKFPEQLIRETLNGERSMTSHGSTDMPIWGPIFRSLEDKPITTLRISNLIDYIRAFQVLD
jgi:mono/diheme cytochrome c family protein